VINSRAYDGTTNGGNVAVLLLEGFVGDETVTLDSATAAAYSSANVGTYTDVVITYTLGDGDNGGLAANYTLANGSASGQITAKALTISAPSIASKEYDGTTAAGAVTAGTLSGLVGSETLTVSGTAAALDSQNVGTYENIEITYTLGDGDNGGLATNYSLAAGSATAEVTAKNLTVSGATVTTKTYDTTDTATITGGSLVGVIEGEDVSIASITGTFDDANAGENKPVTATVTLGGADAGNYRRGRRGELLGDAAGGPHRHDREGHADDHLRRAGQRDAGRRYGRAHGHG